MNTATCQFTSDEGSAVTIVRAITITNLSLTRGQAEAIARCAITFAEALMAQPKRGPILLKPRGEP